MNKEQYQQLVSLYIDLEAIVSTRASQLYEGLDCFFSGIANMDLEGVEYVMVWTSSGNEEHRILPINQILMTDEEWVPYVKNRMSQRMVVIGNISEWRKWKNKL